MFSATDYDKLQQIMAESPEKEALLSRLLESQKMTLSAISHEIRNPLTLVYSTIQLLESRHPEITDFKHWDSLRKDIEYMNTLLDELSSYNNSDRLNLVILDTVNYLKNIVLSFAASLTDTDIEFTSRIHPSLPNIQADPTKLREVILNLLTNAKDALSASDARRSSSGRIHFHADVIGDSVQIKISDNGCGISEEQCSHIFEPFVTYKSNGTGLGLAIASRIVESHNGTLQVSSSVDIGTSFTLTLPV